MKASDLVKKGRSIEDIYEGINADNENGCCKYFIPNFIYIEDSVKLQLIEDGFRVSSGCMHGNETGLIIEW